MERDTLEERLLRACSNRDMEVVKFLLEKGANMNMICNSGRTPFGTAAQSGNIELLKIFLDNCTKKPKTVDRNAHSSKLAKRNKTRKDTKETSNLGYFVYVHKEHKHNNQTRENKYKRNNLDQNYNGCDVYKDYDTSPTKNISDITHSEQGKLDKYLENQMWSSLDIEDALTPDGMDNLEWDMEVQGNEVEASDDPWCALYHWYAGILSETSVLLKQKPIPTDLDREDQYGRRAIHYAVIEQHVEALQLLIDAGCSVNVGDMDNLTPLHLAAARGGVNSSALINLLIKSGANVNHRTSDKTAPLHVSASRGLVENVEALVQAGAHINTLDSSDRTPLFLAVSRGHVNVINYLLEHGVKVNIEEIHGYTPLCEAVWEKDVEIVQKLLNAGAKITQSHYLLHYSILHQHLDMVKLLIQAGSIINLRDVNGDTPLILAVKGGQHRVVKLLLEHGASINCTNSVTGNTALHEAVDYLKSKKSFDEMFSILEEHNVNLNIETEGGYTPLYLAIVHEKLHAAEVLIRHGADVKHRNEPRLLNMFYYLIHRNNVLLAKLLLHAGYTLSPTLALSNNPTNVDKWINYVTNNPMRLQDLCRITIRNKLKNKIYYKVSKMKLPECLKKFIKLEDICDEVCV